MRWRIERVWAVLETFGHPPRKRSASAIS